MGDLCTVTKYRGFCVSSHVPTQEVEFTAGADLVTGDFVLINDLYVVVKHDVASGVDGVAFTYASQLWLTKKTGEAWTHLSKVYYDSVNDECTMSDGAGANTLVGFASKAADAADTLGEVMFDWAVQAI